MTVPTTSWDETSPAGSDNISAGDNRIRELKTQVREVIDVDHDFPSSGQAADVGQHKQVTLQEQADLGTGAVGATILGSQTVSGKGELVYTDEDDNDVQLTTSGKLKVAGASLTDAQILVGNGSGVATDVAVSGDATMANTGALSVSDLTIASEADGDLLQFDGSNWVRVPKGTAGQILESDGTDVQWGEGVAAVYDYGTSTSSSTEKTLPNIYICYGSCSYNDTITNLPFTSADSYRVTAIRSHSANISQAITLDSGTRTASSFKFNSADNSGTVEWMAIGT